MAITTASNPFRHVDTGMYSFFGFPVPPNIRHAEVWDDLLNSRRVVRWRVTGDPTIYDIDFEHATEENILAVLAAMRLSC